MIEENKIMNEIPIYTIVQIEAEETEIPMLTFYVKEDSMDEPEEPDIRNRSQTMADGMDG